MSANINQIHGLNPTTTFLTTDLMYLGRTPFGVGDDFAFEYGDLIPLSTKGDLLTFSTVNAALSVGSDGQLLQAKASEATGLVWSTATYPEITSANEILFSSATNTVEGLATTNSASLLTNSTGVPTYSPTLTDGDLIIGSTGNTPQSAKITAGTGLTVTNGPGSITIDVTNSPLGWNTTAISVLMTSNNGYISDSGSRITLSLPVASAVGDRIAIQGKATGGWLIQPSFGQTIFLGSITVPFTQSIESTNANDSIELVCTTANLAWHCLTAPQGVLQVNDGVPTFTSALNITLRGQNGSGEFVGADTPTLLTPFLTSPTLDMPVLGTPSSGDLTFCSNIPLSNATGILPVGNGGTGANPFTQGSVVFAGGGGVYAQDNSQLFWDDSLNRLGIGNAAPATELDVTGSIRSSAGITSSAGISAAGQITSAAGIADISSSTGTELSGGLVSSICIGGGDATFTALVPGTRWYWGIDTVDSNNFKIARSIGSPSWGTDTVLTLNGAHNASFDGSVDCVSLGVGTSTPLAHTRLHIRGSGLNLHNCLFIENFGSGLGWGAAFQPANNTDMEYISWNNNLGGQVASISTSASQTIVNYNTTSDRRLKENFSSVNVLDNLNLLPVYRLNFIADPLDTKVISCIADELQVNFGFCVSGDVTDINTDGSIKPQQVDYSKLVPILIRAIQELTDRVTVLEAV